MLDDEKKEISDPQMRSCGVCGRYMALSKESQRVYCCEDCAQTYASCVICGNFFIKTTGSDDLHCSEDCKSENTNYFSLFKELDE